MLTVRFPDGTAVQYNEASYLHTSSYCHTLYTSSAKDEWVASVPLSCIVEAHQPCRIYNPLRNTGDVVGWLMDHMRSITNYNEAGELCLLKSALADFNAKTKTWKQ